MVKKVEIEWAGKSFSLESGRIAKQASGAVMVQYGETVVLVTTVVSKGVREGVDFLPLTVEYQEMTYAAGKIPGGFFKREGRPSEREIIASRLIDRPLRPLFPKGFFNEIQIIATVLSVDGENDPDILALIGASTALEISEAPFDGPIAAARVGKIDDQLICNPTTSQMKESVLDLVVAGNKNGIVMVEGNARILSEEDFLEALDFGYQSLKIVLGIEEELKDAIGKPKREFAIQASDEDLAKKVKAIASDKIKEAINISEKLERNKQVSGVLDFVLTELPDCKDREREIASLLEKIEKETIRDLIIKEKKRIGGRTFDEIRPIACEVGILPRTHGSSLFTRGETQALVVTTLGTSADEQRIDSLTGEHSKSFMLHYNFPPFSVGEVKFLRGASRREIGHGVLAEKAISKILPENSDFPYTIRIVSDIMESNGSSSMATICGGILSLMDAGVSIKAPVAGVALGLVIEGDEFAVLSDILGDEDHVGDMDLKVAGTRDGIVALQMDIKVAGISQEILKKAFYQAKEGRIYILDKMARAIESPRESLSQYAPRIVTIQIKQDKIRDLIGPGGKVIRGIVEKTGAKIEVEDSGKVNVASADAASLEEAINMINELTQEAEIGKIYPGKVRKIMEYGAFVEIFPGTDGLIHISQLAHEHVKEVTDILKEGDEVLVKVLEIDRSGKIRLSRKEALGDVSKNSLE